MLQGRVLPKWPVGCLGLEWWLSRPARGNTMADHVLQSCCSAVSHTYISIIQFHFSDKLLLVLGLTCTAPLANLMLQEGWSYEKLGNIALWRTSGTVYVGSMSPLISGVARLCKSSV